jgi:uncharacterized membrane protein YebE (DUF533 family)
MRDRPDFPDRDLESGLSAAQFVKGRAIQSGDTMFDAKKLLDQFIGAAENVAGKENVAKVRDAIAKNPGMAKAAGAGLAAVLLGTRAGRSLGRKALKLGGVAVVGTLAYNAWRDWQAKQAGKAAAPGGELLAPPKDSPFHPAAGNDQERAKAFLSAMIGAAKADGAIDKDEQARIFGKLNELVDGAEAKAFLMEQMMAPLELEKIAALSTSRERAVELYAASAMAIVIDQPSERAWLDKLAARLGIDKELARLVEKAVEEERAAA